MLKFYVKVFRTLLFLNSVVYLFHVWHDDRCWSKILCSMIPSPVYYFKVKVTDLEFLYCSVLQFHFFLKVFNGFYSMDFIHLWRDNRALSKILHSTIPIPVHGLKDFKFLCLIFTVSVFNFYSVSFCKAFD